MNFGLWIIGGGGGRTKGMLPPPPPPPSKIIGRLPDNPSPDPLLPVPMIEESTRQKWVKDAKEKYKEDLN